ncbi:hypothetical protein CVU37_10270 [candidate division BRC1 bacterium HGW-BRC1-1]|jgi:hypothetical protein|nr:MAG: hypothetical protein CVU37_10270 [candidate division BRC1 bacterium HGW-BRC1-1]
MKPLKLTLVTLCCAFVLVAAPYGVKKLFPAGDAANTVVLTELPSPTPATQVEAPMASVASHRAPSVMAALPSPRDISGASIASTEPTPVRRETPLADAAKPAKTPLTFDKDVERAQELLKILGDSDMGVDGKLGPKTLASLNNFRKTAGLAESAVLDAPTLSAMEQKLAALESAKKSVEPKPELIQPQLKSSGVVVELAANERIIPPIAKAAAPVAATTSRVEVVQPKAAFAGATVSAPGSLLNKGEQSSDHTLAAPEGMFAQAKVAAAAAPQLSELPTVKNANEGVVKHSVEVASAGKLTAGSRNDMTELAVSQPAPVEQVVTIKEAEAATAGSVLVKVNADAGSPSPDPMATPVAVGTAVVEQTPDVTRVPQTVLPAVGTDGERNAALEKQLAEAQTRIAMVTKDSRYEAGKYATSNIATVNDLASQVRTDLDSGVKPAEVQQNLVKISSDLEVAKEVAQKKKAEALTAQVESSYKILTSRFGEQARREPLSETMIRVDAGYEAMKTDMKKGNYEPIVQRCEGFKEAIDKLTENAAQLYVADQLADKIVLAKLDKSELKEIDGLKSDGEFVKAADKIRGSLDESKSDSKKSESAKSDSKKSGSSSKSTSKKSSTSEKSAKGGASGSKSSKK